MTRTDVLEKLNEVFSDYFDDEIIKLTDQTTSEDIEDWDSLEHIGLVVAIETAFGIKFSMGETIKMNNVGDMVDGIVSKLG